MSSCSACFLLDVEIFLSRFVRSKESFRSIGVSLFSYGKGGAVVSGWTSLVTVGWLLSANWDDDNWRCGLFVASFFNTCSVIVEIKFDCSNPWPLWIFGGDDVDGVLWISGSGASAEKSSFIWDFKIPKCGSRRKARNRIRIYLLIASCKVLRRAFQFPLILNIPRKILELFEATYCSWLYSADFVLRDVKT